MSGKKNRIPAGILMSKINFQVEQSFALLEDSAWLITHIGVMITSEEAGDGKKAQGIGLAACPAWEKT